MGLNSLLRALGIQGQSSYISKWNKWYIYACGKGISVFTPSLIQVINYFMQLYDEGLQYNSTNSHCSMLSGTLPSFQGYNIDQHPLVICLLKRIFNSRPLKSKIFPLWEVDKVLDHLKTWESHSNLSLADLTRKTTFLLALVTAKRVKALFNLSTAQGLMEFSPNQNCMSREITFFIFRESINSSPSLLISSSFSVTPGHYSKTGPRVSQGLDRNRVFSLELGKQ